MPGSDDVVKALACHASILVGKMIVVGFQTVIQRFKKKAFANKEDAAGKADKPVLDDPDVERVRRIHLNDLEVILPYLALAVCYTLTRPDYATALWHFRVFTVARLAHWFIYTYAVPQPARAIAHLTCIFTTVSMIYQVFKSSGNYL